MFSFLFFSFGIESWFSDKVRTALSESVAVADAYEAMVAGRPYRTAISHEKALDELHRHAGLQFDPDVVRVFLALPEQTWEKIRLQVASSSGHVSHLDTGREEGFLREMLVN